MRKILLLLALAAAAGAAQAQIKCWNDADGKRACGDAPPPGAKVTNMRGSTASDTAPDAAAKDAKKGPLTPAEQDQQFRKRQLDSQKAADKSAAAEKVAAEKKASCAQAQDALRMFESGQRVTRTDANGERYFLDENQIAGEIARARDVAQKTCN
ncbi:MAG TPA: DUF4124 domain-containing protein [Burkholderiales bacterium]|nr:DUF4124 domain-containing protein [Burkholderiales bacterium]